MRCLEKALKRQGQDLGLKWLIPSAASLSLSPSPSHARNTHLPCGRTVLLQLKCEASVSVKSVSL